MTHPPGEHLPPQNLEAERAIIGAMLLNRQAVAIGCERLSPADFYRPEHAKIFASAASLFKGGCAVDLVTVVEELHRQGTLEAVGGADGVAAICDSVASVANSEYYARIVKEKARLRYVIDTCREVIWHCYQPDALEPVCTAIASRIFLADDTRRTVRHISEHVEGALKVIDDPTLHSRGLRYGIEELDAAVLPLMPGDLCVVAARPRMGKTSLAMTVLEHNCVRKQNPAIFFSLEMTGMAVAQRLIASLASIATERIISSGSLSHSEIRRIHESVREQSRSWPLYVDDRSRSIEDILIRARSMKMEHPKLSLVVVDYLGYVRGDRRQDRQNEIAGITGDLKALAKALDVPVLLLAQLNRKTDERMDGRPCMADIKDSGAVEADADTLLMPYRPALYKRGATHEELQVAEILIEKQRNSKPGSVTIRFNGELTRFESAREGVFV